MSAPSERTAAWLYDGRSAIRHDVSVAIEGGALSLDGFDPVPLDRLTRLGPDRLVYGRKDIPGWRLGFDMVPPDALLAHLPAAAGYGGLIDRIGLWRAAAIAALLSAIVVFATLEGVDLAAKAIPYAWEQRIGDGIGGDFGGRACRAPAGQAALDGLVRRLSPKSRPIRIGVVDVPIVNAVALPGGRILIFRGLIDEAASPDEVAGVLAHEIGHVEHRHVMVALLRRFGIGLLIGTGGSPGQYGQALLESRYSRAAESEADDYSIAHLRGAGIGTAATAKLFERLGKDEAGAPGFMVYLASHPPSADRRKRYMAAGAITATRPALTTGAWAAVRAICDAPRPKRRV